MNKAADVHALHSSRTDACCRTSLCAGDTANRRFLIVVSSVKQIRAKVSKLLEQWQGQSTDVLDAEWELTVAHLAVRMNDAADFLRRQVIDAAILARALRHIASKVAQAAYDMYSPTSYPTRVIPRSRR